MLNKTVRITSNGVVGKVVDWSSVGYWVEAEDDMYLAKASDMEVVEEGTKPEYTPFERSLIGEGYTFDSYNEGDFTTYVIEGMTYNVHAYVGEDHFSFETEHQGLKGEEVIMANYTEYKKLNTLTRNVLKWLDK